jgi:hypothetical protein
MWRAGYACSDITPGTDVGLIGYDFRQSKLPGGNIGAGDPLMARALAVSDGRSTAVLVSLDLAVLEQVVARDLRRKVADRVGVPEANVVLACSHTHSGPLPCSPERGRPAEEKAIIGLPPRDPEWSRLFFDRVCDAAARASGLTYPVSIGVRQAPFGIAYNRRVPVGRGKVRHCWNPQESPELDPAVSADPACVVAVLRQTNGPRRFIVFNMGAHGVCLGKTSRAVSADWPGAACRALDADQPHTHSLFVAGACGDAHPWIATQEDPGLMDRVGRAAAAFAAVLAEAAAPVKGAGDHLACAARTVKFGHDELDLTAWNMGGLLLAAMPVELFASLGAAIRRLAGKPILLATCANGWHGYWPDRRAFAEGGYEVDGARQAGRKPGDGERFVRIVGGMIGSV